jgi:hypothetical protein
MIICKQNAEPGRRDAFSRDGYSALCQAHVIRVDQRKAHERIVQESALLACPTCFKKSKC